MGLSRVRVAALLRRRGSVIEWLHALPIDNSRLNPATLELDVTLGKPRQASGPFGEQYMPSVFFTAYLSSKISQVYLSQTGLVEAGDYQLSIPLPFLAACGSIQPPASQIDDYNNGVFFVAPRDRTPYTDRFIIEGARYTAKAKPVPILDHNQTISWRLLVKREEY